MLAVRPHRNVLQHEIPTTIVTQTTSDIFESLLLPSSSTGRTFYTQRPLRQPVVTGVFPSPTGTCVHFYRAQDSSFLHSLCSSIFIELRYAWYAYNVLLNLACVSLVFVQKVGEMAIIRGVRLTLPWPPADGVIYYSVATQTAAVIINLVSGTTIILRTCEYTATTHGGAVHSTGKL